MIARRTALPWLLALLFFAGPALGQPLLRVGSKNFTEQLIVGELWAQALQNAGAQVERRLNLGGTQIAQLAITSGQIDLYPEYTGTGLGVVLRMPTEGSEAEVFERVRAGYEQRFGLTWIAPSRIDNGNVLLMQAATARRFGLVTLSDLARVAPQLTLAAGNEFADRADGLPGLRRVYGMEFGRLRQFAALGLRFAALRHGQADVVNGYATDWQIADGGFVALRDDRGLWPPYQLAAVVRPQALTTFPALAATLERVNQLLDNDAMRALNRQVDKDGGEPRDVAAAFLRTHGIIPALGERDQPVASGSDGPVRWTLRNLDTIASATLTHIELVAASTALALLLLVPFGLLVVRLPALRASVLGASSILYSLPTLAVFAFLVPVLGLGFLPTLVALVTYALPILLRSLVAGLAGVPPAAREAARGMGMTPGQALWRVELPLALPALLGGLRVATVTLVSAATVGAYINAGGLGVLILTGLDQGHTEKILVGAGLVALLALALDQAIAAVQRRLPGGGGTAWAR